MSSTPATTRTPRETVAELFRRLAGDRATMLELYADDVVVEQPFAKPPLRLEGRDVLLRHFASRGTRSVRVEVLGCEIRETDDPEVVVAEAEYRMTAPGVARPVDLPNIFVYRVRDGLVVHSRDYHDHLALAALLGGAPEPPAAAGEVRGSAG